MAYNIILYTKTDPDHPLVWLDLSSEEVKRLFVLPYNRAEDIAFRGNISVHPRDIDNDRLEIRKTAQRSHERLPSILAKRLDNQDELTMPELSFACEGSIVTKEFFPVRGQSPNEPVSEYPTDKIVFVAYGRDEYRRLNLFSFLRLIGLYPLEWRQATKATQKASPTSMETVEVSMRMARAMVILLTPDDEAQLRERFRKPGDSAYEVILTGQARQNVIFEAGMAWAIDPQRTILVEIGKVRPISNLAGISVVRLDNSVERRNDLVERLRLAGCDLDLSNTDWRTTKVIDFELDGEVL